MFQILVLFTLMCLSKSVIISNFKLRIAHVNDMHAQFDQASQTLGKCLDKDASAGRCYGGFPRMKIALKEARDRAKSEGIPFLSLNAGDNYQGSLWFSLYRWRIVSPMINALQFDAMALGTHDFDDEEDGLMPFVKNSTSPIVSCNIVMDKAPELKRYVQSSIIVDRNNIRIGIIGFITNETKILANVKLVDFKDEVECINKEAARLKSLGIKIIIALGHSGYEKEVKIAAMVPDVDVIVGGHSHTFLYTGSPLPDSEKPDGPYPTMVQQKSGRMVPVVQAYAYTKYLGLLDVEFDDKGEVLSARGNPIVLNKHVAQDTSILQDLDRRRNDMIKISQEIVGISRVVLNGNFQSCRFFECNLGNLINDALVDYVVRDEVKNWTQSAIAITAAGNIRNSINTQNGSITKEDILTAFPFDSIHEIRSVTGKYLKEALEWSVYRYNNKHGFGEFLQFSGIRLTYDVKQPPGSRVSEVDILCSDCPIPVYEKLNMSKSYNVIINRFTVEGGDNFTVFKEHSSLVKTVHVTCNEVLTTYIRRQGIVYPKAEGRITFL